MNILLERLRNQHVVGTGVGTPEEVVRGLGAVQSQDYAGAKWSVGQRVTKATDAVVEEAFASGRILRTHVLRPTWHFVMPEDIRWMLRLTAPQVQALNAYYYRQSELDAALFKRTHKLLEKALRDGNQLTRAEIGAVLERAGISAEGLRLALIMMEAELEGLVCSGAPRGKQQTYALLEERAPAVRSLTREEALAELTRRFFTGHAPATLKHFVWWSGLSVAEAKAALAMVREQLTCEVLDGKEWLGPPAVAGSGGEKAACLLPEYDEALVGGRDFGVVDLSHAGSWKDRFLRPVIIGGKRAGTWRRIVDANTMTLETNLFASLNPAQTKALAAAAKRYSRFLGMPLVMTAGAPPRTRPRPRSTGAREPR